MVLFIASIIISQNALSRFATEFLNRFIETLPFLLLGCLTSGLIDVFITSKDIARWLPRHRLGLLIGGVFLGFLFPVGEWGVIPVTRRLFIKGVPLSMGIAFLLAAPVINPIALVSTEIAFGIGAIFIGRIIVTALIAMIVAFVISTFAYPEEILTPQAITPRDNLQANVAHMPFHIGFLRALQIAVRDFFEMAQWLIMGCAWVALLQILLAQESLTSPDVGYIQAGIQLQIQAFILSIGSTGDSALALGFVKLFATGSIISFLSFGAMIDIKSTLMFLGVFRLKAILYVMIMTFIMTLLAGILINVAGFV